MMKQTIFFALLFAFKYVAAQQDTTRQPSVTIVSAFKPVMISPSKINFTATALPVDTLKNLKAYNIPSQNLQYAYQSISLNPLSLQTGSVGMQPNNGNIVKAGYGNLRSPFLDAMLCFENKIPSTIINAYGNYYSANGKRENQRYAQFKLGSTVNYFMSDAELYGAIGINKTQHYLYGYDSELMNYDKNLVQHHFTAFNINAGYRNTTTNKLNINYDPKINLTLFSLKDTVAENTLVVELPAQIKINEKMRFGVNFKSDITRYKTKNFTSNTSLSNDILALSPSFSYQGTKFTAKVSGAFINNNGSSSFLPGVFFEMPIKESLLYINGGWENGFLKNTYSNLTAVNPYLLAIDDQKNTRKSEFFAGITSAIGKFITINAKASVIRYDDFQFFLNDTISEGRDHFFKLYTEDKLNHFRLHGDIAYKVRDQFSFIGGVTFNAFLGNELNEKVWNMLPMEVNASMIWKPRSKLTVKGDMYLFASSPYLKRGNISGSTKGGTDLSLGSEYKFTKMIGAFIQLNNIFGESYQRWYQYPVFGFNATGGVVVRF
jgi:hypothetical protein